jgi:hypothetical protein
MAEDPRNPTEKVPTFQEIAEKKAEEDHFWGYTSRIAENYPEHADERGYTSRIAKKYPGWKAF